MEGQLVSRPLCRCARVRTCVHGHSAHRLRLLFVLTSEKELFWIGIGYGLCRLIVGHGTAAISCIPEPGSLQWEDSVCCLAVLLH